MNDPATMHVGPLGSTIHVLYADAATIAELAAIDWSRHFRRVWLDPVRGLIVLMTPSGLHENLTGIFDQIVDIAGSALTGASKGLRHTRLRRPGEPPGTGMEPDAAFYLGERARGFRDAFVEGVAEAETYLERTAPDLVVEVEITHADEGKLGCYAELGVRELWRLHGRKGSRELRADFLALAPGGPPRTLAASRVLPGLTPADVCEAVDGLRLSLTSDERMEVVARIVRRRQRASVRVREKEAPAYAPGPNCRPEAALPADPPRSHPAESTMPDSESPGRSIDSCLS